MVAVHVAKLHAAKQLLLGEVLGDVGQVQSSLPVVALIQVVFVLEDFLEREGQGNPTSLARRVQFRPRWYTTLPGPTGSPVSDVQLQPQGAPRRSEVLPCCWLISL